MSIRTINSDFLTSSSAAGSLTPRKRDAQAQKQTLDLHGHEESVDRLAKALTLLKVEKANITQERAVLDQEAENLRKESERLGVFTKRIHARGTNHTVTYEFRNSFNKVDAGCEAQVETALGAALYHKLFDKKRVAKVRPEAVERLLTVLGDRAGEFLEVNEVIQPIKNYRETRFEVEDDLSPQQRTNLDLLEREFFQKAALV